MAEATTELSDVDGYISGFPDDVQGVLQELRATVPSVIPAAEETISYRMQTFKQNGGYVVYFGGFRKHVSLYPAPIPNSDFGDDLAPYASGQGTARFPLTSHSRWSSSGKA